MKIEELKIYVALNRVGHFLYFSLFIFHSSFFIIRLPERILEMSEFMDFLMFLLFFLVLFLPLIIGLFSVLCLDKYFNLST